MNILVIGKFYTEGFALHIAETLTGMGYGVRRFEPGFQSGRLGGRLGYRLDQVCGIIHSATDSLPLVRDQRMKALWRVVDQKPLDVVVVCYDFLRPNEVTELKRRTGAAVVLWFPDCLANFGKGFFMNASYDALFFKDPYIVHALVDVLKSPVYYLPECFNPERHCMPEGTTPSPEYLCDIGTAGNAHAYRVAFFKHLVGYDVKLWGNPPPLWLDPGAVAPMQQRRPVVNSEKAFAFRGAKIVVNNLHYGEIWGVNVRTFEASGAGAFQLLDWRPALGQLFCDGKELVSFRGMSDLKQKIDYYLPREEERREVAEAGARRALAEHTYRLRLDLLLATLGGSKKGYPMPEISCGLY